MTLICPTCKTARSSRVASKGGVFNIEGLKVQVKDTHFHWCGNCERGDYSQ